MDTMKKTLIVLFSIITANWAVASTRVGFYDLKCPSAESIVKQTLVRSFSRNKRIAAGILRLHFHDCFVNGCDGSVLLDSSADGGIPEKFSVANNNSATGFGVINEAKRRVEAACPGVVSCADILALAARDSVSLSGGPYWRQPTGRYDGKISRASDANRNLAGPGFGMGRIIKAFAGKGLDVKDVVTLSGAHTLGRAHCSKFQDRLYNSGGRGRADPTMAPEYARNLMKMCGEGSSDGQAVGLDRSTELRFDNSYFKHVIGGEGLLQSDQELVYDNRTKAWVHAYARYGRLFYAEFAKAMLKLGRIDLKGPIDGEIRRDCRRTNR